MSMNQNEVILQTLGIDLSQNPGEKYALYKKRRLESQVKILLSLHKERDDYPSLSQLSGEIKAELLDCLKAYNLLNTYLSWEKISLEIEVKKESVILKLLSEKKDINLTFSEGIVVYKKRSLRKAEENEAIDKLCRNALKKLLDL